MTKDELLTVLNTVAEEFEGQDHDDLARAYRRAATLVQGLEEAPRRRRRRTARNGDSATPEAPATATRRRPGRPRRSQPAPE